ncbi:type VI secretion system-associated FHA domain protein TagH [Henriciella sp. AS95]|uniref:type VI secretion system-associated FHA domain protein TagH n=1 Tax=Henriciella sp. AS95 TaxID=3135782 RepID=UPI0031829A46
MITLKLYHSSDPGRQLDSYILGDGEVTIGRDPKAIWVIEDPDLRISRYHCAVRAKDGEVIVRDTSSNGVFLGQHRRRIDPSSEIVVPADETIHFGDFSIMIDVVDANHEAVGERGAADKLLSDEVCNPAPKETADTWKAEPVQICSDFDRSAASNFEILEAFCDGAQLDPSYFAGEIPADVMRRLGAIYRQVVLGLGELMSERAAAKSAYRLDRTTISATGNNPLKWAPTQRLAVDLLSERTGEFLNGADAVAECFTDLREHSTCLASGAREAVTALLEHLDPDRVEADSKKRSGLFADKSETSWRCMKQAYNDLADDPFNNPDSVVNQAFKRGYERHARGHSTPEAAE